MGKKRKTKKEKIILNLKRQLAQQEVPTITKSTPKKPVAKPIFSLSNQKNEVKTADLVLDVPGIKKDLVKSFLLSLVAITCLFLLYSR